MPQHTQAAFSFSWPSAFRKSLLHAHPSSDISRHPQIGFQILGGKPLRRIFVTHDQDEAFEVADRVVLIDKGSIQQSGTPTEVRNNPANSFVAEFLGLPEKYDSLVGNESQLQTR
jgi:hypothetical protein